MGTVALKQVTCPSKAHVAMSGDIFGCPLLGRWCTWDLVGGDQGYCYMSHNTQDRPPQQSGPVSASTVLRLRNAVQSYWRALCPRSACRGQRWRIPGPSPAMSQGVGAVAREHTQPGPRLRQPEAPLAHSAPPLAHRRLCQQHSGAPAGVRVCPAQSHGRQWGALCAPGLQ